MPVTFGSVGDILSVCLIVKDLVAALDDSRGSSAEYREVVRELWGLDRALLEIELLSRTCEGAIELNALFSAARKAADDCRSCITSFSTKIKKYGPSLEDGSSKNILKDAVMKIKWVTKKDDLSKFRAEVNAHSSSINMLLATASINILRINDAKLNARLMNSDAVSKTQSSLTSEIRDRLKENNELVSAGNAVGKKIEKTLRLDWLRQLGSELKSLMEKIFSTNLAIYKAVIAIQTGGFPSALERSLVQEPFVLEDAIGRITPVHMQFINSWEAFDAVLELRFQKIQGHKKVLNKEYVIQEHATRREIRRNLPWEVSFLPGQRVDMSLIFENLERDNGFHMATQATCPRCQTVSTGLPDSDIQCVGCNMWYRRITEYKDIEPTPIPIPAIPRNRKVAFGQNGFGPVAFGPPKPQKSISTSKRKLSETDLEETENVSYFKRVRVISKRQRVKYIPGPFSGHNTANGEAILNPKAKQEADEREARKSFEEKGARLGMDHPETIKSLNDLAWCLRNRKKFAEAERLFYAAFTASKDRLVTEDPETLQVMARNLMTVLIDQNKMAETGEILQIARRLFNSNLPEEQAETLIERLKLAHVFHVELEDEPQVLTTPTKLFWEVQGAETVRSLNDSITRMQMPSIRSTLHRAAIMGDLAGVQRLLEQGVGIEAKDMSGWTALHLAANGEYERVVLLLLEKGADIEAKDRYKWTALHLAAKGGYEGTIRLLLEKGADIEAKNLSGWTALLLAAKGEYEGVVRLLLEKGADIEIKGTSGWTALLVAAKEGYEGVVRLLLEKGADIEVKDMSGWTVLPLAAKGGYEGVVRLLLQKGADIEVNQGTGFTALHLVAEGGYEGIVRLLLEKGVSIEAKDTNGWTALHYAVWGGQEEIVRLLLEKGADIKAKDMIERTALHLAAKGGHGGIVRLLLESGAEIDAKDIKEWTALHLAAKKGLEGIGWLLLEGGADIEAKDMLEWTALHLACRGGHERTVWLLLEKGAHIEANQRTGCTALHIVAEGGYEGIVRLLLEKGVLIETKDKNGWTALHFAVWGGYKGVVRLLLEKGADIEARRDGRTALHLAAEGGLTSIVNLLLEKGADAEVKDKEGCMALDLAAKNGHHWVVRLLENRVVS